MTTFIIKADMTLAEVRAALEDGLKFEADREAIEIMELTIWNR